ERAEDAFANVSRSAALEALVTPAPARGDAWLRLALPAAATVDVRVYDVQGRSVHDALAHQRLEPGEHLIPLRSSGWPAGIYFCRVTAGPMGLTRRLLVV